MHSIVREIEAFNKKNMKDVFAMYKLPGETPLEALGRVRNRFKEIECEKLSYAGRLDPLAQGVMVVLAGEANKMREEYLNYDKSYYFDVLFGVKSDSLDPLGMVEKGVDPSDDLMRFIGNISSEWRGEREMKYPAFSSKTVEGVPLFQYAREGRDVTLPKRIINIYELEIVAVLQVPVPLLTGMAKKKVAMVRGDFRQPAVLESWSKLERSFAKGSTLPMVRFQIRSSSGTYVRSLVGQMGDEFGSYALAFHIVRTSVDSFGFRDLVF